MNSLTLDIDAAGERDRFVDAFYLKAVPVGAILNFSYGSASHTL